MSPATSLKSLTLLGSLAASGIGLAPGAAAAGPLAIHITPSIGHPVTMDLRDQLRFPRIEGQIAANDPGTASLPPLHIIKRPVHRKPDHSN